MYYRSYVVKYILSEGKRVRVAGAPHVRARVGFYRSVKFLPKRLIKYRTELLETNGGEMSRKKCHLNG